jgi:N6-L-threonylcarbamoyladenine synthase
LKAHTTNNEEGRERVARAFDDAVMEVLISKTRGALEETGAKTLIIAGGVAASPRVKELFMKLVGEFPRTTLLTPGQGLATDNAVMIGIAGFVRVSLDPTLLKRASPLEAQGRLSYAG